MRCLEIEAYRMKEFVISEAQTEKAVLVGLVTQTQNERKTNEYLDELAFLAETAGAEVVKRFTQKLDTPNSVTYVGKGKLQEIREYLQQQAEEEENEIGMVIFDDELSAKQIRNIENELKVKILDRTSLILDIFAMMSLINSNYRVLQVLLAMVIGGAGTISYLAFNYDALQLPTLYWLFLQSLSLYIVYLSFQTLFFERFIACFKIKGNVGFFIATIDFIGYTGTVCVLLFKEFCSPDINWMEFYNQFSGWVGIVCSIAFIGSVIYLMQRYKLERQLRKEEKNKKIIVSPMALTNLKETAENICNP